MLSVVIQALKKSVMFLCTPFATTIIVKSVGKVAFFTSSNLYQHNTTVSYNRYQAIVMSPGPMSLMFFVVLLFTQIKIVFQPLFNLCHR